MNERSSWPLLAIAGMALAIVSTITTALTPLSFLSALALGLVQLLLVAIVVAAGRRSEQSLRRLNAALSHSPVLYYSIDSQARIVDINDNVADMLGFQKSAVIGRQLRDLMADDQRQAFDAVSDRKPLFKALVETGRVRNLKFTLRRETGEAFFASICALLRRDYRGNINGADCVLIDETDCVIAEASLQKARNQLFQAFIDLPVPMFHCDADGSYLQANKSMLKLMGCINVKQLNELGHDAMLAPQCRRIGHSPEVVTHSPQVFWSQQGDALDVQLSLRQRLDSDGGPVIEGMMVDMTDQVKAQRLARDSEMQFRELFDLTPVMLYSVDNKGCMTDVNACFQDTMGYQKQELVGLPALDHFVFEGPRKAYFQTVLNAPENTVGIDVQLKTRCGHIIEGSLVYKATYDDADVFQSAVCSVTDVTLERNAMEQRDQLAEELDKRQISYS